MPKQTTPAKTAGGTEKPAEKPAANAESVAPAAVEQERHGSELAAVPVPEVEQATGDPDGAKVTTGAVDAPAAVLSAPALSLHAVSMPEADANIPASEAPPPKAGKAHAERDGGREQVRQSEHAKTLAINALADARSGEDYGVASVEAHRLSGYVLPATAYALPEYHAQLNDLGDPRGLPKSMLPDDPEEANQRLSERRAAAKAEKDKK
jgi:hypothetical protein